MDMFASRFEDDPAAAAPVPTPAPVLQSEPVVRPIGRVLAIAGSESKIAFDLGELNRLGDDPDPTLAAGGQVGSLVKIKLGRTWVLASVRAVRLEQDEVVVADVDYMGEGDEERLSGKLRNFRRGITRYPTPGVEVYPTTSSDMRQIFATDARAHIEIGTVYPTRDIRGALYVDAMLGKHFALLGSTGTGKSTSAALILHRICELAPEGHIVMIDPHGEYSAAFQHNGALFDASNLQLPYWLMNFEEHCEVFVTVSGTESQGDRDILAQAACWQARSKNRHRRKHRQADRRQPGPLSALGPGLNPHAERDGQAGQGDGRARRSSRLKTKIEEMKNDPRYNFMFSGMLVGDTMAQFIAKRLPPAERGQADLDHRRFGRAVGYHLHRSRGALEPAGVRLRDLVEGRTSRNVRSFWSARRRIATSRTDTKAEGIASVRDVLSRIAKEGRKYGVSLGLITQRPSGPVRRRAVAVRHDHLAMRLNNDRDQAFVRAAMPEGSRAASSIRHPGAAQPRMYRVRRGCVHPDPREPGQSGGAQAPGVGRPAVQRAVEQVRRRGGGGGPHDPALAEPGAVRDRPSSKIVRAELVEAPSFF